jgi:hypothetical protein
MPNTPTDIAREVIALSEKASKGPWIARPSKYDDWGFIRSESGSLTVVARAGQCMDEKDDAYYRATGKDPTQHNMDFVVFARNNAPALASAVLELSESNRLLGDLLAVLHGDGGQHTGDVGIARSVEEATARYYEMKAENERLRDCERIAWLLKRTALQEDGLSLTYYPTGLWVLNSRTWMEEDGWKYSDARTLTAGKEIHFDVADRERIDAAMAAERSGEHE